MASITPLPNGPLKIDNARVLDEDGNEVQPEGTHFVCRCGRTAGMPFCDGTHKAIGFEA